MDQSGGLVAVEELNPHEDVRDRALQSDKINALPREATGRRNDPPLDARIGQLADGLRHEVLAVIRQPQQDGQSSAGIEWRPPEHAVAPGRDLVDLEVCRACFVPRHAERACQQPQQQGQPQPCALHGVPALGSTTSYFARIAS